MRNMNYKMAYQNGVTNREHRFIVEKSIGRKLTPNEIVHHIDGNKRNNSLDNLMIMTRAEHARLHYRELDKSKPVIQMDKTETIIRIWKSARVASKVLNLYPGNISKCCKGLLKTTGGYKWKYAE